MPAKAELTWEPATCRWKKIYKGKSYTVSCRALGVPPTKNQSYQAANSWWEIKKAEIDSSLPPHPHAETLDLLSRRLAWAQAHGEAEIARTVQAEHSRLESDTSGELNGLQAGPVDVPELVGEMIKDVVWSDRLSHHPVEATPKDRTIATQVERHLALERVRVESGLLSVSEFDTIRRCLHSFRDWLGPASSVECLDADSWEAWWSFLVAQTISVEYKKKRLRIAKSFVAWLAEKGQIPVPPNLHSRRHRFGGGARSVSTVPLTEIRTLVTQAPGQLRLHLLLMLNCGMTQVDISDLAQTEVDWKLGRIKRKRSKTDSHEQVPTVDYLLWPQTRQLLQQYARREGDRVLMTETGKPWVRDVLKADGKRSKVDAIKSNYVHLQKKTGINHPMKLLRKTSATLIESHETYGRYTGQFLGHAPGSIAERHYAAPSPELFDKVVTWLGKQYGPIVTS